MGGGIGLLLAFILLAFAGWGFLSAVFAGIVVAVIAGALLGYFMCKDVENTTTASAAEMQHGAARSAAMPSSPASAASAPVTPTPTPPSTPAAASVSSAAATGAATAEKAPAKKPGKKPAAKKPAVKTAAAKAAPATDAAAAAKPAPKKAPAKKTVAKASAAATAASAPVASDTVTPAAQKAPAKPAKAKAPARKAVAADGMPDLLSAPRAGGADDLKLISGVGPKLEQTLNELGIYHYDQVAGLRKKEIEWVDQRLRFKGRIERDDWTGQAKILAKGGETEFSKAKKKKT
tara:strand:+ start:89629 stop:90501 length:873 start_codon:yes stop_codon:yes gene_type:complete